jgi:hypothetical protein
MRSTLAVGVVVGALTVGALFMPAALGGQAPQVYTVAEARSSDGSGPVIVLAGKALSRFRTFDLLMAGGEPSGLSLTLLSKSSGSVTLAVGGDPAAGTYLLSAAEKSGEEQSFTVALGNGKALPGSVVDGALGPALRADLDDAATLGGNPSVFYTDAGNVGSGTLDPARYSAYADLVAEGRIGTATGQVSAGDHSHSDLLTAEQADAVYATDRLVGARVHLSTQLDVTGPGEDWSIEFDVEDFDTDACHDSTNPTRLTANTAGYYQVEGYLVYVTGANVGYAKIKKNGTLCAYSTVPGTAFSLQSESVRTVVYLAVGDYVELFHLRTSGSLKEGLAYTQFSMVRIGK